MKNWQLEKTGQVKFYDVRSEKMTTLPGATCKDGVISLDLENGGFDGLNCSKASPILFGPAGKTLLPPCGVVVLKSGIVELFPL